ncbi:lipoprotein signal peptidase [Propionigenium maris DSM 9537]|uniref:Lipoprotein signal peptidase n=1 Tax=Propionigenium maris DSM 9537 TaxID=1123000 RepID=A0A9W6LLZ5_9FUSO|nr:signal peptidase II [Propionigenium maris]GLI55801.1 lipoprotein signal peptidase [Propionigenium maris DSM 9537]
MYYIILITALIIVDQWTKHLTVANLVEGQSFPLIFDFFHLTYVKNRGVAFGMFQGKIPVISVVTVLAIIGISWYLVKSVKNKKNKLENIAYAFILSGAIGNMIDRLTRGFVVDMMDFRGIWSYVFNLADVWINIGVAFIILSEFMSSRKKREQEK